MADEFQHDELVEYEDEPENGDGQETQEIEDQQAELEVMKARLQEMEAEAAKLRDMQEKVEKEAGLAPSGSASLDAAVKEEVDGRSVYVGNVDYGCTPEELQQHFQGCGTVNRVTILTDKFGNPKGFAYVEFLEPDGVEASLLLDGSELRGRQIKVLPKRTNVPGFKARGRGRGVRGRGRGRGGFYGGGYYPPPPYWGYPPRGRGRGRWYAPY